MANIFSAPVVRLNAQLIFTRHRGRLAHSTMLLGSLRARLAASAARVSRPRVLGAVAGTGVATGAALYNSSVFASDGVLVPTQMPWDHGGYLTCLLYTSPSPRD